MGLGELGPRGGEATSGDFIADFSLLAARLVGLSFFECKKLFCAEDVWLFLLAASFLFSVNNREIVYQMVFSSGFEPEVLIAMLKGAARCLKS